VRGSTHHTERERESNAGHSHWLLCWQAAICLEDHACGEDDFTTRYQVDVLSENMPSLQLMPIIDSFVKEQWEMIMTLKELLWSQTQVRIWLAPCPFHHFSALPDNLHFYTFKANNNCTFRSSLHIRIWGWLEFFICSKEQN